jgi:hypothetical protein
VHRCLRIGAILPPTHSCCPELSAKRDDVATVTEACCESAPGAIGIAQLPPERDEARIAAPIVLQRIAVAPATRPAAVSDLRRHRSGGRPPPGEHLHRLSAVLRV